MDAKGQIRLARMNVSLIGAVEVGGTPCPITNELLIRHGKAIALMNEVQRDLESLLSKQEGRLE